MCSSDLAFILTICTTANVLLQHFCEVDTLPNKSEAMSHVIGYTGTVNTDELETYNKGKKEEDKDYYLILRDTLRCQPHVPAFSALCLSFDDL